MSEGKQISPWVYVGCGCASGIGLLVLGVVGLGFWGFHKANEFAESLEDPDQRREKVLDVLGAETLPDGYYPVIGMSIPFVMDVAVLSDREPDEDGHPSPASEYEFVYFEMMSFGQEQDGVVDFFEGRTDDLSALEQHGIQVDVREHVTRGELDRIDARMLWVALRGDVYSQQTAGGRDGLTTLIMIDCDSDERRRIGIWSGPDPAPDALAGEIPLEGTVADAVAIEAFMAPMNPCR